MTCYHCQCQHESDNINITIGFSTTKKLISKFIRWITRSPVSHAWICFYDKTLNRRFVMQAEAWGYELRPRERWNNENILVAEFKPIGKNLKDNLLWISNWLGSKYDYRSAVLSGLWRWFGRWMKNKFNDPSKLMCAESVIRFLQYKQAYNSILHFDPETTSPKRLLERIREYSSEFKEIQ